VALCTLLLPKLGNQMLCPYIIQKASNCVAMKATGARTNPQKDAARLHGATTENIFGVSSVWCTQDRQQ